MTICGKAHHARCGRPRIAARRKSLRVQIARSWECNQFVCGPGCGNHAEKNPVFVRSYDPCMVVAGCAPRREETSGVARPASPPCGRRAHGQMRRRACRRHAVSHRVADVFEQRSARHRIAAAGTRERAPRAESPADHQAASRFRARRLLARVAHRATGPPQHFNAACAPVARRPRAPRWRPPGQGAIARRSIRHRTTPRAQ
jgi:hypothetical protein